jgi:hypothetical protein
VTGGDVAGTFLHWTLLRAVFHRGYVLVGSIGVLLANGIAFTVTRAVSVIWVNRRTSSDVRATAGSFLSQAECAGEIGSGVPLAARAGAAGIPVGPLRLSRAHRLRRRGRPPVPHARPYGGTVTRQAESGAKAGLRASGRSRFGSFDWRGWPGGWLIGAVASRPRYYSRHRRLSRKACNVQRNGTGGGH